MSVTEMTQMTECMQLVLAVLVPHNVVSGVSLHHARLSGSSVSLIVSSIPVYYYNIYIA